MTRCIPHDFSVTIVTDCLICTCLRSAAQLCPSATLLRAPLASVLPVLDISTEAPVLFRHDTNAMFAECSEQGCFLSIVRPSISLNGEDYI